jgi:hypothetical protein
LKNTPLSIDVEGIAVASMSPLQAPGIFGTKLDTPDADGFIADGDAPFCKEIFDEWSGTPAVTEVETIVQPDRVAADIGGKSVPLISIHGPILAIWAS